MVNEVSTSLKRSPISSLPNELLIDIFLAGCVLPMNDTPLPMIASSVSRQWRRVAINTPILWSRVDISNQPLSILKLFIERSRPCLLDVVIRVDDPDQPHRQLLRQSFDLLVPEIDRLRSLVIDARFYSSVLLVYMMLHLQYAPHLEHFAMSLGDPFGVEEMWREPENTFLDILSGGAPMLASFQLWGVSLHYCHPPLRFLRSLSLTTPFDSETALPISSVKLRNILGSLSRLERLSLHGRILFIRAHNAVDDQPIALPLLRTLEISAPHDESGVIQCDYIKMICSMVAAPQLLRLWINFLGRVYSPPFLQSIHIQSKSGEPILSSIHQRALPRKYFSIDISLGLLSSPASRHPFLPSLEPAQLEDILLARTMAALHADWSELRSIVATEVDEYRLFRTLGMSGILGDPVQHPDPASGIKRRNTVRSLVICNSQLPLDKDRWLREQVEYW